MDLDQLDMTQARRFAEIFRDPTLFAWTILNSRLWETQRKIANAVANSPRVAVKACHASGKCVEANEWITSYHGDRYRASELIGKSFCIPTPAEDGKVTGTIAHAADNGVHKVYRLVTETGREIVRTAEHPLWSGLDIFPSGNRCRIESLGFTPIRALVAGDLVAVAEEFAVFGDAMLPEAEIKMLAYLIGDGGVTANGVVFTQSPNKQLSEFEACADELGCIVVQRGKIEYGLRGKIFRRNPIRTILHNHGLQGKHSRDKFVPERIFGLQKRLVALFLNRLYGTDGWACVGYHGVAQVGYASASKKLIHDIQDLLIRFGVSARIEPKPQTNSWTLSICTAEDILRFEREIGIFGKEPAMKRTADCARIKMQTRQIRKWRRKNAPPKTRWERVMSVEMIGERPTVSISVPSTNTFYSPFYEHNTFLAAIIALWFVTRYKESIVLTTAPTWQQVENVLWAEIRSAVEYARSNRTFAYPEANRTELRLAEKRYALGLSTNEGVRFQGYHSPKILIIIDEAPGVKPEIFEAMEGIRAGGDVRVLMLGNPVIPSGHFYDAFHNVKERDLWKRFTISAFDTPNFKDWDLKRLVSIADDSEIGPLPMPYLVTPHWVRERYFKWGVQHAAWNSRVLGEFPKQSDFAVFPSEWVYRCRRPATMILGNAPDYAQMIRNGAQCVAGIDVAGPGEDETVLAIRVGGHLAVFVSWSGIDATEPVLDVLRAWRELLSHVVIDANGIGYYFAVAVANDNFKIRPVNFGEKPVERLQVDEFQRFYNLRAEMFWHLREWMQNDLISGINDEDTLSQLTGIQYTHTLKGLVMIEPKEDAKKRGVASPDRAEALVLAYSDVLEEMVEETVEHYEPYEISRY